MKVAILKYNAGNIYSVINSLKRLGVSPILTDDIQELTSADRVILPGQGEAKSVMTYLYSHNLDKVIYNLRQPVLGICIGMQLMCRHSEEGDTDCLDIFHVNVKRFIAQSHYDKIPAVGWNEISNLKSPLFKDFTKKEFVNKNGEQISLSTLYIVIMYHYLIIQLQKQIIYCPTLPH